MWLRVYMLFEVRFWIPLEFGLWTTCKEYGCQSFNQTIFFLGVKSIYRLLLNLS